MQRSCRLFGVSRQGFYQYRKRTSERQEQLKPLANLVAYWRRLMPRLGARKLYYLIKPELMKLGIKLGRDGFIEYLRGRDWLVKPLKNYTKTTFSHHHLRRHPNRYAQMTLTKPNQVYVSDITYVRSEEGVHYLSLVTDGYSRKIVGHHLSQDMTTKSVLRALPKKTYVKGIVHHSDRGVQYCSKDYQKALKKRAMLPSTTDGYDCYQNALAERVNGILKQEFLLYRCKNFQDLKRLIDESITTYNRYRPHLSLGMKTPSEVHKKARY